MSPKFPLKTRMMLGVSKVCAYGLNAVLIAVVLGLVGVLIWGSMFGLDSSGLTTGVPDGVARHAQP
jgi:hypothetical protein